MAWRVHLTNQAIRSLDILSGKPPLLAVWTHRERVAFFDLETGAPVEERVLKPGRAGERQSDRWREFVASLVAPNRVYLPVVHTPQAVIYATNDGQMRLYQVGDTDLFLDIEGKEIRLEASGVNCFLSVGLDRVLGLIAALDDKGKIHIFQQHISVGVFDLGLSLQPELPSAIVISHGGAAIFVSDGHQIVLTNSSGRVRKQLEVHYFVGKIACSPNGKMLATSDLESGVLRLYNGDLMATHQRHAFDLLADATQLQLLADLPPADVALTALAAGNDGVLAFAMAGVVCVTDMEHLDALPRPQRLL
jgi:WD40 repeat protein